MITEAPRSQALLGRSSRQLRSPALGFGKLGHWVQALGLEPSRPCFATGAGMTAETNDDAAFPIPELFRILHLVRHRPFYCPGAGTVRGISSWIFLPRGVFRGPGHAHINRKVRLLIR